MNGERIQDTTTDSTTDPDRSKRFPPAIETVMLSLGCVVVGGRGAVWAPVPDLAAIVVQRAVDARRRIH